MIIDVYINKYDPPFNELAADFVKFICKEYSILPRKISVESSDLAGSTGMCFDEDDGKYTILVRNDRDLGSIFTTIAHEMIHVKQYMTQDLGRLLDENVDMPYEERWWEAEAFDNAVSLVEKFSKTININR